jgi:hypothetical protein
MHLPLTVLSLCAAIGNVNAAFLPISITTPSRQIANVGGGHFRRNIMQPADLFPVR